MRTLTKEQMAEDQVLRDIQSKNNGISHVSMGRLPFTGDDAKYFGDEAGRAHRRCFEAPELDG